MSSRLTIEGNWQQRLPQIVETWCGVGRLPRQCRSLDSSPIQLDEYRLCLLPVPSNASEDEIVDARDYKHISMTFWVGTYFGQRANPWVTVRAQFTPNGSQRNLVTLHSGAVDNSCSLKHTTMTPLTYASTFELGRI